MIQLLIVSIVWAFSFGLIKGNLAGLDPGLVAFARLFISLLLFIPFLRIRRLRLVLSVQLTFIGMIQFGVMYLTYIAAYQYLDAYQVALYTIFTPLYVAFINDVLERRFSMRVLLPALLAVIGTYVVRQGEIGQFRLDRGFLLLQVSNLCFAFGQVAYKRVMFRHQDVKDHHVFALLYLGAVAITAVFAGFRTEWGSLSLTAGQVWILLYLGVLASGICFFLWNLGARKVHTGTLAIFNNLKVPLAVACSLLFFHEAADLPSLLLGGGIIVGALLLNERMIHSKRR